MLRERLRRLQNEEDRKLSPAWYQIPQTKGKPDAKKKTPAKSPNAKTPPKPWLLSVATVFCACSRVAYSTMPQRLAAQDALDKFEIVLERLQPSRNLGLACCGQLVQLVDGLLDEEEFVGD